MRVNGYDLSPGRLDRFEEWQAAIAKREEIDAEHRELSQRIDEIEKAAYEAIQLAKAPDLSARRDLNELYEARAVLDRARQIHADRMLEIQRRQSAQIREEIEPQYRDLIDRKAKAVAAVAALERESEEFVAVLQANGILLGDGIVPLPFNKVGRLDHGMSHASLWLRRAAGFGYIKYAQ